MKLEISGDGKTITLGKPDGSKEIYKGLPPWAWDKWSLSDFGTPAFGLVQDLDPAGNALNYSYDTQGRLISVTDAAGQVTTLSYERPVDPAWPVDAALVTKVTDPFGRSALLTYNADRMLDSITDTLGLKSSFTYGKTPQNPSMPNDFMNSMTTPYGTTTFRASGNYFDALASFMSMSGISYSPGGSVKSSGGSVSGVVLVPPANGLQKWIEIEDPLGNRERLEYNTPAPVPTSDPVAPAGFMNGYLQFRNVFFWDKRAMAQAPGDYSKAFLRHYLHGDQYTSWVDTLESSKRPLEGRVWYAYPGQDKTNHVGSSMFPSKIARVLDDGTEQDVLIESNLWGKPTKRTDPLGRVTTYKYSPDGIDLLEVHNNSGGIDECLVTLGYNAQHLPTSVKDASGQVRTYTYNGHGQILTATDPKGAVTSVVYDDLTGLPKEIDLPTGSKIQMTWDGFGRPLTVTNPAGGLLTYDYDVFDRPTAISYPDGTSERMFYDKLDMSAVKDRNNKYSYFKHNALRQLVELQSAEGQITKLDWCSCGSQLEAITDPLNRITNFIRDLEGHVISKVYPDGHATSYGYDGAGRLNWRKDAKGQSTNYSYFLDNDLKGITYTGARVSTAPVSYHYESAHNRLDTVTDGTGTHALQYYPIAAGVLGAGRPKSLTESGTNSTVSWTYDELGRVAKQVVDGREESWVYDGLGRLGSNTNDLGAFTYDYNATTTLLDAIHFPNGQVTSFSYDDAAHDNRLLQIRNATSTGSNLSTFGYTYDPAGQIKTWTQQADAQNPKAYSFTYDAVGQVLTAALNDQTPAGAILKRYVYGYDDAGNRTSEQIDGMVTTGTYNNLNQLMGQRTGSADAPLASPSSPAAATKAERRGSKAAKRPKSSANSSR